MCDLKPAHISCCFGHCEVLNLLITFAYLWIYAVYGCAGLWVWQAKSVINLRFFCLQRVQASGCKAHFSRCHTTCQKLVDAAHATSHLVGAPC